MQMIIYFPGYEFARVFNPFIFKPDIIISIDRVNQQELLVDIMSINNTMY
jgi:hypothetical protein